VTNFSKDVSDGENYTVLLNQLKPDVCSRAPLQTRDLHQRAEEVRLVLSGHPRQGSASLITAPCCFPP
jgi:plastin-1